MKSSPVFRTKETDFYGVRSNFSPLLNAKCGFVTCGTAPRENTANSKQEKPFKFFLYTFQQLVFTICFKLIEE